MKKFLIIGFALVVVIAVTVVYLYSSLDRIIQTAIETIGSDLTQNEVRLDEVEISPTSGNGALRGFRVTNPNGFSDDNAFRFTEVNVTVDIGTLQGDPVVIKEIIIDGPRIIYEFAGGTSNLDTLKNNVESRTGGSGRSSGSEGSKIVIKDLYLRNGTVGISAPVLAQKIEVPLPTVHLKDVGNEGNGATPGEVAQQVVDQVLASAQKAATNANLDLGDLQKTADQIAGEARKQIQDATQEMGGAVEKGAGDAGKAIEGLIKGIGK